MAMACFRDDTPVHTAAMKLRHKLHRFRGAAVENTAEFKHFMRVVSEGSSDIAKMDFKRRLPIHILLDKDRESVPYDNSRLNLESVKLVSTKETVNVKDSNGRTSLHMAVSMGRLDIVTLLRENGASCQQVDKEINGKSPLQIAVASARIDLLQAMHGEMYTGKEARRLLNTALQETTRSATAAMVEYLLDNCVDVNGALKIVHPFGRQHLMGPLEWYCAKRHVRPFPAAEGFLLDRLVPTLVPDKHKLHMIEDVLSWSKPSVDMPNVLACLLWHFKSLPAVHRIILEVSGEKPVKLKFLFGEILESRMFSLITFIRFSNLTRAWLFMGILLKLRAHTDAPAARLPVCAPLQPNSPIKPSEVYSQKVCDVVNALYQQTFSFSTPRGILLTLKEISLIAIRKVMWRSNRSRSVDEDLKREVGVDLARELLFEDFVNNIYEKWKMS